MNPGRAGFGPAFFLLILYRSSAIPVLIARINIMKLPSNLGMLLLGIWLILYGVIPLLTAGSLVLGIGALMSILAIVAGVLILMGR